jgi:hypothetical protein
MIKLLDSSNKEDLKILLSKLNTVMGQSLDAVNPLTLQTRRVALIEYLCNSRLNWSNTPGKRNIGWFHEGELKAVLFQDFSTTVKAWSISYYFSSCKSLLGRRAGGECLDFALQEAERLNYYEYYRVIEAARYHGFHNYADSKLRDRYMLVLDEVVPAHERPMTSLTWDWLFEGNAKDVDVAVVKGVLKSEYRSTTI